jgi:hypothetical protein
MVSLDRGMLPATTRRVRAVVLSLALLVVGSPAWAAPRHDTEAAMVELRAAVVAMTTAASARASLSAHYEAELRAIDTLKKQRGSWRRDRQLRDSLAASLETAKKLEAATAEQKRAAQRQDKARQQALAAVAAELATSVTPARAAELDRARGQLAPPAPASKKIVIPDLEIDPLADPEELDQQAAEIRQSEAALAVQVASLDQRSEQLSKVAELRRQHSRAIALSERDDQTRRGSVRAGARTEDAAAPNSSGGADTAGGSGSGSGGGSGDNQPPVTVGGGEGTQRAGDAAALAESSLVLGDVIDAAALESLRKAQTSSDPAIRAAAAKGARDAAAAKLVVLRKQRAAIEARARALREP